jgi:outer membrane protein assembly factor BamD (BamD/ComL family)
MVSPLVGQEAREILSGGIEEFKRSDFSQALVEFRKLLVDPEYSDYRGDAYFWTAKATMALDRLEDAEENLEYYLLTFPDHPNYAEARYQKARLLYLQHEYEAAISAFQRFIDAYPSSPFVANAYYWSGEALFELGHLSRARTLFQTVVEDYPTSFRVEAARYRISIIELKSREEELLKLLRFSHEESLRALEEFRQREQTYQEALAEYRRRLASLSEDDFRAEIEVLRAQIEELNEELAEQRAAVTDLRAKNAELQAALDQVDENETGSAVSSTPAANIDETLESALLALKAEALDLKEFYLNWLRNNPEVSNE